MLVCVLLVFFFLRFSIRQSRESLFLDNSLAWSPRYSFGQFRLNFASIIYNLPWTERLSPALLVYLLHTSLFSQAEAPKIWCVCWRCSPKRLIWTVIGISLSGTATATAFRGCRSMAKAVERAPFESESLAFGGGCARLHYGFCPQAFFMRCLRSERSPTGVVESCEL